MQGCKGIGGWQVTYALQKLLNEKEADYGISFTTNKEFDILMDIKEKLCRVGYDIPSLVSPNQNDFLSLLPAELLKKVSTFHRGHDNRAYELPDGRLIKLGEERYQATECIWRPELLGIKDDVSVCNLIGNCVAKAAAEEGLTKDLYGNIVLAGGNTMFPGYAVRLKTELLAKSALPSSECQVVALPGRKHAAWMGGSILSSLSTFKDMWISKAMYDESGPSVIEKCC